MNISIKKSIYIQLNNLKVMQGLTPALRLLWFLVPVGLQPWFQSRRISKKFILWSAKIFGLFWLQNNFKTPKNRLLAKKWVLFTALLVNCNISDKWTNYLAWPLLEESVHKRKSRKDFSDMEKDLTPNTIIIKNKSREICGWNRQGNRSTVTLVLLYNECFIYDILSCLSLNNCTYCKYDLIFLTHPLQVFLIKKMYNNYNS